MASVTTQVGQGLGVHFMVNEAMMAVSISPDHARQKLVFYVDGRVTDVQKEKIQNAVKELATARDWLLGAPRFVDANKTDMQLAKDGLVPPDAIGGLFEIYSALPPWELPHEVDERHFQEVSTLVARLCDFSKASRLSFEIGLDDVFVGSIDSGKMSRFFKQNKIDYIIIGSLFAIFGMLFFTNNLRLLLKAPGKIQINASDIFASFYRNRTVRIPLVNVVKVTGTFGVSSVIKICYDSAEKQKSLLIHVDRLRTGEKFEVGALIEEILQNTPNIQEVDVEKFIEQVFRHQLVWGKSPDWTIINTAKRRAEENRKKLKQPQTETQGTKESA
ncbi:MAG: hypothetical protein J0L53_08405 [Spirochaetes bacterium]|nr:hypothetical protein [Spirochaetota bacterium]